MQKRIFILCLLAGFMIGCGNKKPKQSTKKSCDPSWSTENTVINHWVNYPPNLLPTNENSANKSFVFNYIHSFLLIVDLKTLELKPDLVKSLPTLSSDGLTYDFELKDGITWDDGTPITTEDVIFTYKANACGLINNGFAKPYIKSLAIVEAVDGSKTKFKFVVKEKYILNDYLPTYFPILQRSVYDKNNVLAAYSFSEIAAEQMRFKGKEIYPWADEMNGPVYGSEVANILGAGPYKIESWEKGQTLTLVKKQNHWTSKQDTSVMHYTSYPDKIIFKTVADESATKIELNNQSLDVTTFLSTKALQELEKDSSFTKNYYFDYVPAYNATYLIMNNKPDGNKHKKFFDDQRVRRAMAHLTPVEDVIKVVYFGKADRLVSPVHPQKKGFNNSLQPIALDINKANQLLDEAGWKDSDNDGIRDKMIDGKKVKFEFKIMYPSDSPVGKDIADLVIESMKKAMINPIADGMAMKELVPRAQAHDFDMTFFAFGQSALPDDFEQLWSSSSWSAAGSNLSGYGNPASDSLIIALKSELDWSKRIPMMQEFQQMVYDEQPVIFFLSSTRKIIIHRRFSNANMFTERPGVMLNTLKLICTPANTNSNVQ